MPLHTTVQSGRPGLLDDSDLTLEPFSGSAGTGAHEKFFIRYVKASVAAAIRVYTLGVGFPSGGSLDLMRAAAEGTTYRFIRNGAGGFSNTVRFLDGQTGDIIASMGAAAGWVDITYYVKDLANPRWYVSAWGGTITIPTIAPQ